MSRNTVEYLFPEERRRRNGQASSTPAQPAVSADKTAGAEQLARAFYDWCGTNRNDRDPRSRAQLANYLKGRGMAGMLDAVYTALGPILASPEERSASAGH